MPRTTNTEHAVWLGLVVVLASGCSDDGVSAGSEPGGSTSDMTGSETLGPSPDFTTTSTTTSDPDGDTRTDGGQPLDGMILCEPACEDGLCCIAGACFAAPEPTCAAPCAEDEQCLCPRGSDPCDCEGQCVAPESCPGVPGTHGACFDEITSTPDGGLCTEGANCIQAGDPLVATVCMQQGCVDACECPAAPRTGDAIVTCADVTNDGANDCYLDCSGGDGCPDGMRCYGGLVCVWSALPQGAEGFGNCGLPTIDCLVGERCLDDSPMNMEDPAWTVCGQQGCIDLADCGAVPPPTGNAPVACGDPLGAGGANRCYLDCSAGQACPDGMACYGGTLCAWPSGPLLFADDFEAGDFSLGWAVVDVDMQTPNVGVGFVTEAWVVSDEADGGPGNNLAATSTSWYEPVGMSDDWLISPQIVIGPNTRVYWESRSFNAMYPDGFELRISTAGPALMDFTANPALLTVAVESTETTAHFIDLAPAGYTDQPVRLAWRNVTDDGWLLTIDNVAVVDLP